MNDNFMSNKCSILQPIYKVQLLLQIQQQLLNTHILYIHKHFSILYMHTCMHMCVFICVSECMCVYVCIYMFLDVYAYIHTCINSYTQAQIHTFILLTSIFDYVLTLQLILLDQLYPILVLIKLQQTMIIVAVDVVVLQYC